MTKGKCHDTERIINRCCLQQSSTSSRAARFYGLGSKSSCNGHGAGSRSKDKSSADWAHMEQPLRWMRRVGRKCREGKEEGQRQKEMNCGGYSHTKTIDGRRTEPFMRERAETTEKSFWRKTCITPCRRKWRGIAAGFIQIVLDLRSPISG